MAGIRVYHRHNRSPSKVGQDQDSKRRKTSSHRKLKTTRGTERILLASNGDISKRDDKEKVLQGATNFDSASTSLMRNNLTEVPMVRKSPVTTEREGPHISPDIMDLIISKLPMSKVMQMRTLSRDCKNTIFRSTFINSRRSAISEGTFSPVVFTTDPSGALHWLGFDGSSWLKLPPLNFSPKHFPSPDADLFKDYLVACHRGLLCINVGKAPDFEKIIVCNPLKQQVKVLPPLNFRRHPVLMHLRVYDTGHYTVVVAGSAAMGNEELSFKTEQYDSRTGEWECPEDSDLSGLPFCLNEFQNGAYYKNEISGEELLLCVGFIESHGRGVLVYDLKKKKWIPGHLNRLIPLMDNGRGGALGCNFASTQIVEHDGCVYLFSEQECGNEAYFRIHKLNIDAKSSNKMWVIMMVEKRSRGRGLLVYPEFTCVPFDDHQLAIFNTIEHTIETIDFSKSTGTALIRKETLPTLQGNRFHSLNPVGFVYRPSFTELVCPSSSCDVKTQICSECERREKEKFGGG
ncbi:uncharacterized protein [Physcomitrium patens]|nr:uncharacterized protein LOC112280008 [Physcomitrium patens]XP_024370668.1 uncharacterized protein LOC112280008 [Physcomitrium patens]XP_024370669.1 uncharacterized protein LOC112280008 [Physcomitrium patens]PNR56812.1 hypothetical protein PHYPA_003804 [Physcomitrium patens]|eukprot:XP_024370667.1 uncharacterized protein LOC112280008 [Physcomitrella patens]